MFLEGGSGGIASSLAVGGAIWSGRRRHRYLVKRESDEELDSRYPRHLLGDSARMVGGEGMRSSLFIY